MLIQSWHYVDTCLVTSTGSRTVAEWARLEPLARMARWNSLLVPWHYVVLPADADM